MSQQLDPEALRELMQRYQQACRSVIEKYEGHVAQYLGDGLMVYFGFPRAHEDDAERAVRSALEIVEAVSRICIGDAPSSPALLPEGEGGEVLPSPAGRGTEGEGGLRLQVCIGIATGPVVVGETGAGDASVPKLAVGETPNLAARFQGLAAADEIVISLPTRRLLGASFDLLDLGPHVLKGIVEPMHAYRVLGLSKTASRFEAATSGGLTPLVGRDLEIGLLLDRWALSREGEGQVVVLSGEPGIGKSRILSALHERLGDSLQGTLRFQCSPYHVNSAFYPSIDNLERALKFARDELPESKLDKLEALMVRHFSRPASDVRFIASILSIPCEARYGTLSMTPQRFKEETIRSLVDLTHAAANKQASVMLFEDAHWADPTTLEVLDLLIDRVKEIPLLLLITHRPEFQPKWTTHGHVTALNLSKFTRGQTQALVSRVTRGKALPADLTEKIVAKTDGVPLFAEELTKAVLESGNLTEHADRYEYVNPNIPFTIPATLRDSLMARLDRIQAVKEVAQIGAAIGREFSYELIEAVAPMNQSELHAALDQLTSSGLAFKRGQIPDATYLFKHALVQDTAYQSLLKSKRQQLHAQIATAMERISPNVTETHPELLAHHLTQAGHHQQAVSHWLAAGQRALTRLAASDAVNHLSNALKENAQGLHSPQRDEQEIEIRLLLAQAYLAWRGWAAVEIAESLYPARDIATRLGKTHELFLICTKIGLNDCNRIKFNLAPAHLSEMHSLADTLGKAENYIYVLAWESVVQGWMGNFIKAQEALLELREVYDPQLSAAFVRTHGFEIMCGALQWAQAWLAALGYPDQARDAGQEQLAIARRTQHPFNVVWCLMASTRGLWSHGEFELAASQLKEGHVLAEEHGLGFFVNSEWAVWHGLLMVYAGNLEEGEKELEQGIALWRSTGWLHPIPEASAGRAAALKQLGRHSEAMTVVDEAIALIDGTGFRMFEADLHRIRGEVLITKPDPDVVDGEASLWKSLEIARAQNAKGLELRTATSLARLWQSQGKGKEAHDTLAPIYNWFTEGFDTKDLKDAKALLEELRAGSAPSWF